MLAWLSHKKLRPALVGPFIIRTLHGTNAVQLNYSERFQLLNPIVNIAYLRPYRLRTPDVGPLLKSLSTKPVEVEVDGSSWYQVEDILDHRGSPGPMCECLVRWKDFDVSHDSWVKSKFLTPLVLQSYEQFLTDLVRFVRDVPRNLWTCQKCMLKNWSQHVITCLLSLVMVVTQYSRLQLLYMNRQLLLSLQHRRRPILLLTLPLREERLLLLLHLLQDGSFVDLLSTRIQDVST